MTEHDTSQDIAQMAALCNEVVRLRSALELTAHLDDFNFCGLTGAHGNALTKAISTARKVLAKQLPEGTDWNE